VRVNGQQRATEIKHCPLEKFNEKSWSHHPLIRKRRNERGTWPV